MSDGKVSTPGMLTIRDVAGLLQCSPRTIYRLVQTNRIPAPTRIGSLVRWPRAVIDAWISSGGIGQELLDRSSAITGGVV